ncbi:MAG: hypothetical protein H6742_08120 [Alphaproteobacteria bacterium]|nr:hypothetical protein [Alphaproteobacteria bacterium]
MSRPLLASLPLLLVLACTGTTTTAEGPGGEAPPPAGSPELASTEAPAIDKATLEAKARDVVLVPSPTEMQNALAGAGIAEGLSTLVPDRAPKMDVEDKDVIAVRTGTVLAWSLLTVKDAPTDKLVERMGHIKGGMTALGAGTDINATIDDLTGRLQSDSLSREDMLAELDELHGAIIPEIEYEAGERVVPLIKAGSWLAGVNLISQAIVKAENVEAANKLLKQPEVADYFLAYARSEGADKAPPEVMSRLEATLNRLKELSSKDSLTIDDVKEIQSQTDAVLALL